MCITAILLTNYEMGFQVISMLFLLRERSFLIASRFLAFMSSGMLFKWYVIILSGTENKELN